MMRWRLNFLIFGFSALYLLLIFNLYDLQFNKNLYYSKQAEAQQDATGVLKPLRGNIYFTDKNNGHIPVAINKEFFSIYAVPDEITSSTIGDYAEKLSPLTGISADELKKKFGKSKDRFESLISKASVEQAENAKNLRLKGVYAKTAVFRFYPFDNLASNLLGFVNQDVVLETGRYGLEAYYNDLLGGKAGEAKGDKIIMPVNGKDIFLTLDKNIQTQSEDILKKLASQWDAASGNVIVQEPKTGKILAMANYPDFNPNDYSKFELKNFMNTNVQAVFEDGSVSKVFTMAAGIDSKKITSDTTYFDSGSITINGRTIKNWDNKAHGKQTMTNVIEKSLNTGAVFAEKQTGHKNFYSYLLKFGFGEKTGVSLPGEVKGSLGNLKNGRDIHYATASYGQGISVTPIQLISAISAIANNGLLMKPLILADESPEEIRRVISEETADKVTQMMVSAVEKSAIADISDYSVAGKTGTAYIPEFGKDRYTDETIHTFVGFAPACVETSAGKPACDPKFTILIKIDKPSAALAASTVTPAFRELAQFILNYYNIAPDNLR